MQIAGACRQLPLKYDVCLEGWMCGLKGINMIYGADLNPNPWTGVKIIRALISLALARMEDIIRQRNLISAL